MQYVRSISGSVGAAWNSINPAMLLGAIDVIVVEQDDGSLACSPFHVRFWQMATPTTLREEGRIQSQWPETRLPNEAGRGRGGLLCLRDA